MKAVIQIGGQQHIVSKGDELVVDRQKGKSLKLEPLLVFDEKTTHVGNPIVKGASVNLSIDETELKGDKIKIMKFKAKKRQKTLTGHRQPQSKVVVKSINLKS